MVVPTRLASTILPMPARSASAPAVPARSIAAIVVSLFKPQAKSKLSQIQQNPAKPGPRKSKEKAWISLDFLGGNEPFQGVAPTPQALFSFSPVRAAISNSVYLVEFAADRWPLLPSLPSRCRSCWSWREGSWHMFSFFRRKCSKKRRQCQPIRRASRSCDPKARPAFHPRSSAEDRMAGWILGFPGIRDRGRATGCARSTILGSECAHETRCAQTASGSEAMDPSTFSTTA